jgi:hypothetical protein
MIRKDVFHNVAVHKIPKSIIHGSIKFTLGLFIWVDYQSMKYMEKSIHIINW